MSKVLYGSFDVNKEPLYLEVYQMNE